MKKKSGEVILTRCISNPHRSKVKNADGSISDLTIWHGVCLDVTDELEKYSHKECENCQNDVNDNSQPCFGVDKNGLIQEWNLPMSELTGFDRSEVLNKHYDCLRPEYNQNASQIPFLDNIMSNLDLNAKIFEQNLQLRESPERGEGHGVKYVYATFRKRVTGNNEVSGVFCTCDDITALKLCEKEKDEMKELLHAERNLVEWLSHEIRNPLSIAMEASHALKDAHNDTDGCKLQHSKDTGLFHENGFSYVDIISECIVYVVELLSNLLDLNKCVQGKIVLRPKQWMLREDILSPIIQMMSIPKHTKNKADTKVPIYLHCEQDIKVYIDRLRLKQVITNLLSNAIKFTTKGFIRVSISTEQNNDRKKSDSLRIAVSDSGPGISSENYEKLFKKWEQFSATSNGSGLGLCISRHIVNAMGGTIDFDKEYHSGIVDSPGAQFVVNLPMDSILALDDEGNAMYSIPAYNAVSAAVIANANAEKKIKTFDYKQNLASKHEIKTEQLGNDLFLQGKFRILIVDDDKVIRKIFRRRFSRLIPEAIINERESGEGAIELTMAEYYDVIFIDQHMGKMNGDKAIKIMRQNGVDSLIIGISANARSQVHMNAGAQGFFQKPIPKDAIFLEKLITHLSPPSGWRVLILDDAKVNLHFLKRKLHKLASPYFISNEIAQKHWTIISCVNAYEAINIIENQELDLIILDNEIGDNGFKGVDIVRIVRKSAKNKNAVVVINSGSCEVSKESSAFDVFWPKPLPSVEQMRLSLCQALIKT